MSHRCAPHARRAVVPIVSFLLSFPAFSQWTVLDVPASDHLYSVHNASVGNIWLGALDTVYWSGDNGDSFDARPTTSLGTQLFGLYTALHAFNANTALITGTMNTGTAESIYRTTTAGTDDWNLVHYQDVDLLDLLFDLEFGQAPLGFAVGTNGRILRTTDNGQNWTPVATSINSTLRSVAWAGGNVYLTGGSSSFLRSTDGGLTWSSVFSPSSADVVLAQGSTCYAVSNGTIWKSTNAGAGWTAMGPAMSSVMDMLDANTLVAANLDGLFRSGTSGQYWEQFQIAQYGPLKQIDFRDALNGIAVGENGYAIGTSNAGGPAVPVAVLEAPPGPYCTGLPISLITEGDPAWTYQWLVDGQPVSTAMDYTATFTVAGAHIVSLVAFNGTGYDTASVSLPVPAGAVVPSFTAYSDPDTVCAGESTTVHINGAQPGIIYRLLKNGVIVGQPFSGNGMVTVSTGSIPEPYSLVVQGTISNACGADTLQMDVPVVVTHVPPGASWSLVNDSACAPVTPVVRITSSGIGYEYTVNGYFMGYAGNGGVLDIPQDPETSGATVNFSVRTQFVDQGCYQDGVSLGPVQQMHVWSPGAQFSVDNEFALVGQTRTMYNVSGGTTSYFWDFGADAVPATSTDEDPGPVSWATSGLKTITLTCIAGDNVCTDEQTRTITVLDPLPTEQFPSCAEGFAGASAYIADMYLDRYNNRYLTGYHHPGGQSNYAFFAMKLDSTGQMVWQYNGAPAFSGRSFGYGITADVDGNAYITGRFDHEERQLQGTAVIHPQFIVKFDRQGQRVWHISSPANKFRGIACTPDNRIHVAGYAGGAGLKLLRSGGGYWNQFGGTNDPLHGEAFLISLDTAGNVLAMDQFGMRYNINNPGQYSFISCNSDLLDTNEPFRADPLLRAMPDGSLLIAGLIGAIRGPNVAVFNTTTLLNHAARDTSVNVRQVYVATYLPGTGFQQAALVIGGKMEEVQGVSAAPNGDLLLCGRFRNAFVRDDSLSVHEYEPPSYYSGPYYNYIARANAEGQVFWHGITKSTTFHDVAAVADGSFYALASFAATGVVPTGSGGLTGLGSGNDARDKAVLHYAANGTLIAAEQSGGAGTDVAFNLRPDACGNLHIAALSSAYEYYQDHNPVFCTDCTDNLSLRVLTVTDCAPECFAAYDPALRDVALETIALSDTAAVAPEVRVRFRNAGQMPVSDVVIAYRVNEGAVQTIPWSGSLAYAEATVDFNLTALDFNAYNVARVQAWVESVNGSADDVPGNDTVALTHMRCFAPIQGIYSCGGDGTDFRTITDATRTLAQCGIAGTTTIAINAGTYLEQVHFTPIAGVGPADTVVFRSAAQDSASVLIRFEAGTVIGGYPGVRFEAGVDRVSLKDLSFTHQTEASGNCGVHLIGNNDNNNLIGCHFTGIPLSTAQVLVQKGGGLGLRHFRVKDCTFDLGYRGLSFIGGNTGNQANSFDSLLTVTGSVFNNQFNTGMYLWYERGMRLHANRVVTDDAHSEGAYRAIYIFSVGTLPYSLTGNTVLRSTATYSDLSSAAWVYFPTPVDQMGRSLIANNVILNPLQDDELQTPSLTVYRGKVDILHNTIGGRLRLIDPDDSQVLNNIIFGTAQHHVLDIQGSPSALTSDGNIFCAGVGASYPEIINNNDVLQSLTTWTALTAEDQNSFVLQPQFVSTTDLHLASGANDFNSPFAGVFTDIDGDPRSIYAPRPGADEGDNSVSAMDADGTSTACLWPTVSDGRVQLALPAQVKGALQATVLDARGRVVASRELVQSAVTIALRFDLPSGTYRVCIDLGAHGIANLPMVILH